MIILGDRGLEIIIMMCDQLMIARPSLAALRALRGRGVVMEEDPHHRPLTGDGGHGDGGGDHDGDHGGGNG